MNFPSQRIQETAKRVAALVGPSRFDAGKLLLAIAEIESSFGANANPRHEAAYCRGGKYFNAATTAEHGCLAHCSFGPWQVMYPTAVELGYAGLPLDLSLPEINGLYAARYLAVRAPDALSLEQIARAYNGGNVNAAAVPQSYIDKLTMAYQKFTRV